MTGANFYTYVLKKFIRTDKETEAYQATTDIIADMRIQFNSEPFKEEAYIVGISTLGEYRIAVPSDFGHIIGDITCIEPDSNDRKELNKIDKQEYDRRYADRLFDTYGDMYSARPFDWCLYGDQFFIGPVPDKVTYKYQINYTTEDYTEVTSGTADVPFSDRHRNTLRSGVLSELHELLETTKKLGIGKQYITMTWLRLLQMMKIILQIINQYNITEFKEIQYGWRNTIGNLG